MGKVKFTTTIDRDILRKIKIQAIVENKTVSDILDELLRNYLAEKGGE